MINLSLTLGLDDFLINHNSGALFPYKEKFWGSVIALQYIFLGYTIGNYIFMINLRYVIYIKYVKCQILSNVYTCINKENM